MIKTRQLLLIMLGGIMIAQLSVFWFAGVECAKLARLNPSASANPSCQKVSDDLQRAVDAYIAVILALLIPTDGAAS